MPDLGTAKRVAAEMGYPVIIKATAGGGGRGMRVIRSEAELANAYTEARGEALKAFGDDTVFLEKFIDMLFNMNIINKLTIEMKPKNNTNEFLTFCMDNSGVIHGPALPSQPPPLVRLISNPSRFASRQAYPINSIQSGPA